MKELYAGSQLAVPGELAHDTWAHQLLDVLWQFLQGADEAAVRLQVQRCAARPGAGTLSASLLGRPRLLATARHPVR